MSNDTNNNSQQTNDQESSNNFTSQQWEEMREERKNNDRDPAPETPQDANTGKHINFLENEEDNAGGNANAGTQTSERWQEMRGETKNNDKDPE